jgi:4-amino-4-deoxy-L-arabinose transferase-like glycosyltransferase
VNLPSRKILLLLIAAGILARIVFMLFFVDLDSNFYWEYGEIAKNLISGKGYSFYYLVGYKSEYLFKESANPYPSAIMPPGYPFFLASFMLIKSIVLRNVLILLLQTGLAAIVSLQLYKLSNRYFSEKVALIAAGVYALLPEFIYTSSQFGTTIIYHFFILSILLLLSNPVTKKSILKLTLLFIFLAYFRSEALLLYAMIMLFFVFKKKYFKTVIISVAILLLALSPWMIRNIIVFESFVPMSTSGGINFYRGHNSIRPGAWMDKKLVKQIRKIPRNDKYELNYSRTHFEAGIEQIKKNPVNEVINSFFKVVQLWVLDAREERSNHPIYYLPWFLVLFFSLIGLWKYCSWSTYKFFYIFFTFHTILAVVFFALPRYQIMMKIALIPFAAAGAELLISSFRRRN